MEPILAFIYYGINSKKVIGYSLYYTLENSFRFQFKDLKNFSIDKFLVSIAGYYNMIEEILLVRLSI